MAKPAGLWEMMQGFWEMIQDIYIVIEILHFLGRHTSRDSVCRRVHADVARYPRVRVPLRNSRPVCSRWSGRVLVRPHLRLASLVCAFSC